MAGSTITDDARSLFANDQLPPALDWVAWLSPLHARLFAVELAAALASPTPDAGRIEALLDAWRGTAELDASPELRETIDRNRKGNFLGAEEWLAKRATG